MVYVCVCAFDWAQRALAGTQALASSTLAGRSEAWRDSGAAVGLPGGQELGAEETGCCLGFAGLAEWARGWGLATMGPCALMEQ